ncbi:hypothetical protein [Gluconobacter kanchanaburiensis]|uniref:Uncharacterized protein n=1 Tax=Gluconobacter kanchanaburiensis NBRC 103587 TaxID=1307948 RepID=A0A511B9S4_9PROT|nr:hypothetical protein [Gluconobacter kanchanaburiensis]MBF0862886.1 hypothetical protein [Gluconobacter kanchanaburiensis]GBR72013.1 hypothetical protein AA103587_2649 [Gluconobacter kanchanaburiensis NBRC 103587]GEK97189.1 hypothetical protein GKA01_23860 [Gluconobacter kanchanaburiensis NBRC 103587]
MQQPEKGPASSDLERLMQEARAAQAADPIEESQGKHPNIIVWALLAAFLVLISVSIHFLWPAS